MNINRHFLLIIVLTSTLNATELLLLDTSAAGAEQFNTFMNLTKIAGFSPTYQSLYQKVTSHKYKALFVLLDPLFLEQTTGDATNPFVENVLQTIKKVTRETGTLTAFLVPGQSTYENLTTFWRLLELPVAVTDSFRVNEKLIFKPDVKRAVGYRTTLVRIRRAQEEKILNPPVQEGVYFLPTHFKVPEALSSTLPFGCAVSANDQCFFLGAQSSFLLTELEEPFLYTPVDKNLRYQLQDALALTLVQLHNIITKSPLTKKVPKLKAANRAAVVKKGKIQAGWMEIEPFSTNMLKGVKLIKEANLDLLWISFNPEWYLSKNATRTNWEPIKKITSQFTLELKRQFPKKFPEVFVGLDLTNNFGPQEAPWKTVDAFGRVLPNIPTALSLEFWEEECFEPLAIFIKQWNEALSNGLPLSGVFFDLEMYQHPVQAEKYSNLMDFSDLSWNLFAGKDPELIKLTTHEQRIACLFETQKFTDYFTFLQKEAFKLGKIIRERLSALQPGLKIGVYIQTLSNCWFYKGLLEGMSSAEQPLILATFNTDFHKHQPWLSENRINATHLSAVMLSHLESEDAASELEKSSEFHDGIWVNRFSRFLEPCEDDKCWYRIEWNRHDPLSIATLLGNNK